MYLAERACCINSEIGMFRGSELLLCVHQYHACIDPPQCWNILFTCMKPSAGSRSLEFVEKETVTMSS